MAGEAQRLAGLIRTSMTARSERPFVVAIDGRSGAGKSTLAAGVADLLGDCLVIDGDDFYNGGRMGEWKGRTSAEQVAEAMDWRRQHALLATLRDGRRVEWFPYDWEAFDGSLAGTPLSAEPAPVVILEGAYSCRPELADLLDLRVLVEADLVTRSRRLRQRDGEQWHDEWFDVWNEAEDFYFGQVVSRSGFGIVLVT